MTNAIPKIWNFCDKFLDHDAEDVASGVSTEERLSNAIETIEAIAVYAEKGMQNDN